ncbi:DUF6318 family protein [Sanguibacter sp. 25GB23B1]
MPPRHYVRTLTVVGGLAALLTLGACTADPEPSSPPSATSTPTADDEATTAPSEPPAPPEKPAAMANDDEAGARAAADYFLALYGYTLQSGDVTLLDAFCHDESSFCATTEQEVADQTEAQERFVGGDIGWTGEPAISRQDDSSMYVLKGEITQAPLEVLGPDGDQVSSSLTGSYSGGVAVFFDSGAWWGFNVGIDGPTEVS